MSEYIPIRTPLLTHKGLGINLPIASLNFKFNSSGGEIQINGISLSHPIRPNEWYAIPAMGIAIKMIEDMDGAGLWSFSDFSRIAPMPEAAQ